MHGTRVEEKEVEQIKSNFHSNASLLIGSLQKQCTVEPSTQICFAMRNCPSAPKREAIGSTKEQVNFYQTTWHHIKQMAVFIFSILLIMSI
jgi:hypothetical protein